MRPGFLICILSTVFLTACSSAGWPGQYGEDPTAYDFPIVQKRWDAASRSALGSAQDISEIKVAVQKAHPDLTIHEIRWISATEVMAYAVGGEDLPLGFESFYCALEKEGDQWRLVAWYSDLIS